MRTLFRMIYRGNVCDRHYTDLMIRLLEEFRGYGEHLFNGNVGLGMLLPRNILIREKGGSLENCIHSTGVIDRAYSISIMVSDFNPKKIHISPLEVVSTLSACLFEVYAKDTKPSVLE